MEEIKQPLAESLTRDLQEHLIDSDAESIKQLREIIAAVPAEVEVYESRYNFWLFLIIAVVSLAIVLFSPIVPALVLSLKAVGFLIAFAVLCLILSLRKYQSARTPFMVLSRDNVRVRNIEGALPLTAINDVEMEMTNISIFIHLRLFLNDQVEKPVVKRQHVTTNAGARWKKRKTCLEIVYSCGGVRINGEKVGHQPFLDMLIAYLRAADAQEQLRQLTSST